MVIFKNLDTEIAVTLKIHFSIQTMTWIRLMLIRFLQRYIFIGSNLSLIWLSAHNMLKTQWVPCLSYECRSWLARHAALKIETISFLMQITQGWFWQLTFSPVTLMCVWYGQAFTFSACALLCHLNIHFTQAWTILHLNGLGRHSLLDDQLRFLACHSASIAVCSIVPQIETGMIWQ